jgi:nitrate reductase delta subunit
LGFAFLPLVVTERVLVVCFGVNHRKKTFAHRIFTDGPRGHGNSIRDGLMILIDDLASGDLLTAEERYVELFDRGRATSLNLFEHLHGESRDRGDAMVELKRRYERAGFELATRELPDHLPVVLEYLSCRGVAETGDVLRDCTHLLKRIGGALIARESSYAAVLQALLVIAGEAPLDPAAVPRVTDRDDNMDRDWFEQPAFGGEPLARGTRTGRSPIPGPLR